ncbi:MAG: helix-turn-helix domain-containing protein [Bryobacteraceae bacterium]|nr:helix-turn-helix domain-containing protein [Bryobacteraceae bacterium]
MTFQKLQLQLIHEIARRVQAGDTTVSSLARRAGISQPHLHLVLQGKRGFSWDFADRAALVLGLRVEDLIDLATPSRPLRGKLP